jgi:protein O-GlcNAc transferase
MSTNAELIEQAHDFFRKGNSFCEQGRYEEAAESFRQGTRLNRSLAGAYINQGIALAGQNLLKEAINSFREALRINPNYAAAHYNLGTALKDTGYPAEAENCYRQVLRINPNHAETHNNLGNVLKEQGKLAEATASFQQSLRLDPQLADAHNNLGIAFRDQNQFDEAAACYRQALSINPKLAHVHYNLGSILDKQHKLAEALACYQQVLLLDPNHPQAHNNLGMICKDQGRLDQALAYFQRALDLKPDYVTAHSNLIYTLHYCPGKDAADVFAECRRFNDLHAVPLKKLIQPHANDKTPERRLRIGYVSPDLGSHPVGRFFLPLLEAHDKTNFEIYCYSGLNVPDAVTERCRELSTVWRPIFSLPDEHVAQLIRQDRIDILVDLTMHTADNRLLVFARKPAPVQVTYLSYCSTTGLDTIDYRLTDPAMDPPGLNDRFYSEQTVRLPHTYWCYHQAIKTPEPVPPPVLQTGQITFGCLNNFCKMSVATLDTWCRLLQAVPDSRLLLHAHAGDHCERLKESLVRLGIAAERLLFMGSLPITEYFRVYQHIDIGLDPFPYGGGTTTCDALWMGVPVVTLAGRTGVGRGGVSILTNIGMSDWIAQSPDEYVRIAADSAQDWQRLGTLRGTLRDRMRQSPLMDAPRFARDVEDAYREMWRKWCAV